MLIINNNSAIMVLRVSSQNLSGTRELRRTRLEGGDNMNRKIIKSALVVLDTLLKIIIICL